MYEQKYWIQKVTDIIEEQYTTLYRKMKKAGTLQERIQTLGEIGMKEFERNMEMLRKRKPPQNNTIAEVATTNFENETMARELTEEYLHYLLKN